MALGGLVLGSHYTLPQGHEDSDVPTFWVLLQTEQVILAYMDPLGNKQHQQARGA